MKDTGKPRKKRRRWRKVFLFFGIALVVYLICIIADETLLPDNDLKPPPWPVVSEENNALTHLLKAVSELGSEGVDLDEVSFLLEEDALSPESRQFVELELGKVKLPFQHIRRALSCKLYVPPTPTDITDNRDYVRQITKLRLLLSSLATYERQRGNLTQAVSYDLDMIEIGRRIYDNPTGTVSLVLGFSFIRAGYRGIREAATDPRASFEGIRAMLQRLPTREPSESACIRALKWDYVLTKHFYVRLLAGEVQPRPFPKALEFLLFKPNKSQNELATLFRILTDHSKHTETMRYAELCAQLHPSLTSMIIPYFLGNGVGKYTNTLVTIDLTSVTGVPRVIKAEIGATKLVMALRAHELATGHLPADLDGLVPGFLQAVPRDPYDHMPFRYSVENRYIYSVGRDLIDNGGDPMNRRNNTYSLDPVSE